jgi:hypothetical protein
VYEGHRAFPFVFPLDPENFKWAESRGQLGAGDDSDAALGPFARASPLLSFFKGHEERRIISGDGRKRRFTSAG